MMPYPNQPKPSYVNYQNGQPEQYSPDAVPTMGFGRRRRIESPSSVGGFFPFMTAPNYNYYPYYSPYYQPYYPPYPSYSPYPPYPYPTPYPYSPYSPYAYAGAEQYQSAQPVMADFEDHEQEHDEMV
ncbi:hypothetical protein ACQCN2_19070 [Brevibacillus ginsengisoli]|uniref:hypothetical protein n=1 Tax=Brevibacillus ginsengisoli TaxID=363854 RepID=UPI003CEEA004